MRNTKRSIDEFLGQQTIAVVGVSRNKDKFGTMLYRDLKAKGRKVYAVNPNMDMVEGDRCYAGLGALPVKPDAVVIVLPPTAAISVIDDMAGLGIKHLWLQQGAESREAEEKAQSLGMNVVSGECLFMYLPPVESIHGFHRFFKQLFGGMPK
jgi:predicted CoA-binding protein